MIWEIRQGDALERLREMPAGSVHLIATSPPYYALRRYSVAPLVWGGEGECDHQWGEVLPAQDDGQVEQTKWKTAVGAGAGQTAGSGQWCRNCGAWRGDLGLEPTPQMFVQHLLEIFREAGRVLRDDGLLFVNLADSYAGAGAGGGGNRKGNENGQHDAMIGSNRGKPIAGLRPKSLIGIPWRFALAMIDEGWILRAEIVWAKKSPMPESVTDRPTRATESIFMFAKAKKYYYDSESIKEPVSGGAHAGRKDGNLSPRYGKEEMMGFNGRAGTWKESYIPLTRNIRNFWLLGPEPSAESHYATFPQEIPRRCILAGTSEKGCCPQCGAPWKRAVERNNPSKDANTGEDMTGGAAKTGNPQTSVGLHRNGGGVFSSAITTGWQAGCSCNAGEPVSAVVCDPFAGTSTTGVAALKLGRSYIGLELSPEYCRISERRLRQIDAWQPSML